MLQGHLSAALVHLGNISFRLGKETSPDDVREAIGGEKTLTEAFDRFLAHLDANEIDLGKAPICMGPTLTIDPQQERFTGPLSESTNMFIPRNYREPYIVSDTV